ncbi:MAG: hypothetical protein WBV85_09115 [Solirubrobacteraceae bacterium]
MAQLSRPYQIALAVVAVLGLVWAVALRSHGPGSSPSGPAPTKAPAATSSAGIASASSSTNAAAEAKAAAAATPIYHGAAPGVEGLTRAIAKAHGAVATSQRNAQELQHKSGEASQETQTPGTGSSTSTASAAVQKSLTVVHRTVTHAATQRTVTKTHVRVTKSANQNAAKAHPGRSPQQVAVEAELARGKTVMLVFWDPKSSVDREVLLQADALAGGSKGTVTVHAALASQVGLFGKITEVVHVYQTPTILIVNRQGVVSTLTGLTDVFSLQQAVSEAREAKG